VTVAFRSVGWLDVAEDDDYKRHNRVRRYIIYVYFNATGVLPPDVFINLQCNELCSCRRLRLLRRRRCFLLLFFFYDGFIQRRPIRRRCNASFTVPAIILLSYERIELYIFIYTCLVRLYARLTVAKCILHYIIIIIIILRVLRRRRRRTRDHCGT